MSDWEFKWLVYLPSSLFRPSPFWVFLTSYRKCKTPYGPVRVCNCFNHTGTTMTRNNDFVSHCNNDLGSNYCCNELESHYCCVELETTVAFDTAVTCCIFFAAVLTSSPVMCRNHFWNSVYSKMYTSQSLFWSPNWWGRTNIISAQLTKFAPLYVHQLFCTFTVVP